MKARTVPTTQPALPLASEIGHYPYAEYTAELQDLFSHSMDRALGLQKASFDAVVKMQSEVLEIQLHLVEGESASAFNGLAELATEAFSTCLELQMTWLNLLVSCAQQGAEIWMHLAGFGLMLAGTPDPERTPQPVRSFAVAKAG